MGLLRGSPALPAAEGRTGAGPDVPGPPLPGGPQPQPPPPPPLPSEDRRESPAGLRGRRAARLRNFNWEAIPAERIRGRRNLWTEEENVCRRRRSDLAPDFHLLEELFGQRPEPLGGSLRGQAAEQVSLLEPKKVLNLGIFLKQFKRPAGEIVEDLRVGEGAPYGAEKLLELTKMLPDGEEVKRLEAFQGDRSRLSDPEIFALLLVQVPSYTRRLELLVLKEEFFPQLNSLRSAIQILTEAALELLDCEELHDLIRLVLKAGNYMNEGGYAGSALGFRVPSLLRLADTKANRPGMDLLHFVALEAERKDPTLLCFPSKLQHVGPASRIMEQEVLVELRSLGERLQRARGELPALGWQGRMGAFLEVAEAELGAAMTSWEGLRQAAAALAEFLCEEPQSFSLPASCGVFQAFTERFLAAVQENRAREVAAHRQRQPQCLEKQKRRSIATCSSHDPGLEDVELDALFHRPPHRSGRRGRTLRGPHSTKGPPARERSPSQPLWRRHTLAVLPTPEPETEPNLSPLQREDAPTALVPTEAAPSHLLQEGTSPDPDPPATPRHGGKKAKLFGKGLVKAYLGSSPGTPTAGTVPTPSPPPRGPTSPETPRGFRFSSLFSSKRSLPAGAERPTSLQPSPKDVSTLVGFFRRLSLGEKLHCSDQP